MQVEARNTLELQKSITIECTKNQILQAELKESRATVVKLDEELKELNLNFQLERRESSALNKECQLLRKYVIPLVRRIIQNGLPLEQLEVILDALHNGTGDNPEDVEDWESDRQEAESSNTTTEDRGSADEPSAKNISG